jgi:hypothetical protein
LKVEFYSNAYFKKNRLVDPEHSSYASMLAGLMIAVGVATGLFGTKLFELIVLM